MTAAAEVFPGAEVSIEHSASTVGGYFCEVRGHAPFTQAELWRDRGADARDRRCRRADRPRRRCRWPRRWRCSRRAARTRRSGCSRTGRRRRWCSTRSAAGRTTSRATWCRRPAASGTSRCTRSRPGFLLQFPHQGRPTEIGPLTPYPKLFQVFEEAGHWLDRLGIRSAGALNDAIAAGRLRRGVAGRPRRCTRRASPQIAADIAAQGDRIKVVLIAGPSSSGKTTFSKRLAVQLLANGRRPFPDRARRLLRRPRPDAARRQRQLRLRVPGGGRRRAVQRAPAQPDGRADRPQLPRYNFKTGRREPGRSVTLGPGHIIIVEGIHGLNPALVPGLPPECVYRVYVSALTQLNLDRHNRVSTTDCRLIRRIVRDAAPARLQRHRRR